MVGMVEVGVVDLANQIQLQRKLEVKETSLQFLQYKVFLAVMETRVHQVFPTNMVVVAVVLVKQDFKVILLEIVTGVMEAQLELKVVQRLLLVVVEDLEAVQIPMVELVEVVVAQELELTPRIGMQLQILAVAVEVVTKMAELVVQV